MKVYTAVLAQILRHLLTAAAVLLAKVGVDKDMQNELVETTIFIIVPIILAVVAQWLGYLQKRFLPILLEKARQADPETSVTELKLQAAQEVKTIATVY
jgi:hypothetical protein